MSAHVAGQATFLFASWSTDGNSSYYSISCILVHFLLLLCLRKPKPIFNLESNLAHTLLASPFPWN